MFKGLYDGAKFSTYDNDNDSSKGGTCAITSKCGWWYYVCDANNPNERPHNGQTMKNLSWLT